jgi:hypothetical protein
MNLEQGVLFSMITLIGGCIYQMGRLSNQVERLEEWRKATITDLQAIRTTTDRISAVLDQESAK